MTPVAGGRSPAAFVCPPVAHDWERMWAPYDPSTYKLVLDQIAPHDHIYDIGAGDLRLARQMAAVARQVTAIEIDPGVLAAGLRNGPLPANLIVIQGDALAAPVPAGVTLGVLLMRHCTHFSAYAHRLAAGGCRRLVTNARWGMGVEWIDLQIERRPYAGLKLGWYACECGAVGFKPGPAEDWAPEQDAVVHEVDGCPKCNL